MYLQVSDGSVSSSVEPFLIDTDKTKMYISRKSRNYVVAGMFKFLSLHLTRWSIQKMFDVLELNWTKYDSQYVASNDTYVILDKFVIFIKKLLICSSRPPLKLDFTKISDDT